MITLPVFAQNVLILDNTVVQPENSGIERMYNGQPIRRDYPLSLDSMVWSAIGEIATVFDESNFFNTIAIYRKPIRRDTEEWLSITKLSPEEQSDFYDTENYDALFVIDRLLFSVEENVKTVRAGTFSFESAASVDLRADGLITCSMYYYGKEKPLTTFIVSDSLIINTLAYNDSIELFKEIPEYVLHELSRTLGNLAATPFIPTWKTSKRQLFVSHSPRMKEATGYAIDRQWANAESIWMAELEKKTKPVDKAKIAFNLAVANEMRDQFDPALEWALKAGEYLKSANPNNNHREIELTNEYISELARRIQNNRLLDLQWGKE